MPPCKNRSFGTWNTSALSSCSKHARQLHLSKLLRCAPVQSVTPPPAKAQLLFFRQSASLNSRPLPGEKPKQTVEEAAARLGASVQSRLDWKDDMEEETRKQVEKSRGEMEAAKEKQDRLLRITPATDPNAPVNLDADMFLSGEPQGSRMMTALVSSVEQGLRLQILARLADTDFSTEVVAAMRTLIESTSSKVIACPGFHAAQIFPEPFGRSPAVVIATLEKSLEGKYHAKGYDLKDYEDSFLSLKLGSEAQPLDLCAVCRYYLIEHT